MATTIQQAFRKLRENLEISDLQEKTVSTRQSNVRAAVEDGMSVLDSFLTGSYRRSTMIAPLKEADVDIFVVLEPKYYSKSGQATLLDSVRRVLKATYPKTPKISRNGRAVTISFSDFVVDVVPSFYRKGGGYLIPDSTTSEWIATDPNEHVELWSASNKAHAGDLVPLIKMVKAWNKTHLAVIRSFHLECMVRNGLEGVTISDFPTGVRYAIAKLMGKVKYQVPDPAGYDGDVGAYLVGDELDSTLRRLENAYEFALKAERAEAGGNSEVAFGYWRRLFRDYFPAYD
jgi:hypothetical protein